jgi:hypothetical protein
MSAGAAARRHPESESGNTRQLPADVLRFAALPEEHRRILLHVSDLLGEISFGNVVIVLQDGKVIQIETSEKVRLR